MRLGPNVTITLVNLSAVVGKIAQTTWRMVQFMEKKLCLTYTLGTFALIVGTFLVAKRSIQNKLCVKLANVSNERDLMAPISITRAYEAKLKSRK